MKISFLVFLHIVIIVLANFLTQFPFPVFGFFTTYGAFMFPFIFLITDLTVRLMGASKARRVIFIVSIPVIFISWFVSSVFYEGHWQGVSAASLMNFFMLRIALASFAAYCFGQLVDIFVFNKLRQNCKWYVAPAASMTFGNLIDSVLFFFIAFYASPNPVLAEHWFEIALFDTVFKAGLSLLFLLPAYGTLLYAITHKKESKHV